METRSTRTRVANACDLCKLRKIRCSGGQPCGYCTRRRQPDHCRYTAPRRRPPRHRHEGDDRTITVGNASPSSSTHSAHTPLTVHTRQQPPHLNPTPSSSSLGPTPTPAPSHPQTLPAAPTAPTAPPAPDCLSGHPVFAALEEHEETEVPREARLLSDAQGKLVFIGDCAPLSFFQSVRRLVTSRVDAHAFAPEAGGYSSLENAYSRPSTSTGYGAEPPPIKTPTGPVVSAYLDVTAGLIDLFDNTSLPADIAAWAEHAHSQSKATSGGVDVSSAVNYLVLAIGCQKSDEHTAQMYFGHARNLAFASLSGNLGVASVQIFILITFYSLGAGQINGAFLFFGIAARAAYSIGIHRTAVNARFSPDVHRQRDRLWKSLRVLDLFLSTSMGRPPATSDVDCTVPYRAQDETGQEKFDLLNASAQIFQVTEAIVLEVYSRRKISPRLTEGISRELREWSTRWLHRLKEAIDGASPEHLPGMANGACQVLSSYYYSVILVSRPFLMVELHRRLSDGASAGTAMTTGKSKLADACIDAAILMVEPVQDLIERGLMTKRAPVVVYAPPSSRSAPFLPAATYPLIARGSLLHPLCWESVSWVGLAASSRSTAARPSPPSSILRNPMPTRSSTRSLPSPCSPPPCSISRGGRCRSGSAGPRVHHSSLGSSLVCRAIVMRATGHSQRAGQARVLGKGLMGRIKLAHGMLTAKSRGLASILSRPSSDWLIPCPGRPTFLSWVARWRRMPSRALAR